MKTVQWKFLGHWASAPLTTSLFAHYYVSDILKKYGLPQIHGGYKAVNGDVFVEQQGWEALEDFFHTQLSTEDFTLTFKFIEDAKKSAWEFFHAGYNYSSLESFMLFLEKLHPMMCYWLTIHQIDAGIEKALEEKSRQQGIPLYKALAQIRHKNLEFIERDKNLSELARLWHEEQAREEDFADFLQKYSWISINVMWGHPLTREKLMEELSNFQPPLASDIEVLNLEWPELKIAEDLAYLRFHFMECLNKVAFNFWPLFESLAKELGLTFEEIVHHTRDEIMEQRYLSRKDLQERMKKFGLIVVDDREIILTGVDLERESAKPGNNVDVSELKGMPASLGKAQGRAQIVMSAKEFYKMRQGDILVVPETTPDYVPLMKLSSAIVTDKGGITSHAAIVSREMCKPCIIGTKIATKVFKDGDMVEVDANTGVVKKIK